MRKKVFTIYYTQSEKDLLERIARETNQELVKSLNEFTKNPTDFSLVLFTGGADVDPKLYNDTSPLEFCSCNPARDHIEKMVFNTAKKNGVRMAGICRGIQFLNVMCGGKLMHHIESHAGSLHPITTIHNSKEIVVNSLHHQMILPTSDTIVTAITPRKFSKVYIGFGDKKVDYKGPEIEGAIFPEVESFGVQYHPEMMQKGSEGREYFMSMAKDAITIKSFKLFMEKYGKKDVKYISN